MEMTRQAGELAERFSLRGYDAVHLASALGLGEATTMISWDEQLRNASFACGCAIAPAG